MRCSSEEVHPFIWTKPIISQYKYGSRELSASLTLSQLVSLWFGNLGGQRGCIFPSSEGNGCCYYSVII